MNVKHSISGKGHFQNAKSMCEILLKMYLGSLTGKTLSTREAYAFCFMKCIADL